MLCANCRQAERRVERVDLYCRRCGAKPQRTVRRSRLKWIPSYRSASGRETYVCVRCNSRTNGRKFVRTVLKNRVLKGPGTSALDARSIREAKLKEHAREHFRPQKGVDSTAAKAGREAVQANGGMTQRARDRVSIGHLVKRKRTAEFRLCPGCNKLHQLSAAEIREGVPGFHNSCWQRGIEEKRYAVGAPAPRYRHGRGRPHNPEELDRYFRWLLRYVFFRESRRHIADTTLGYTEHAVIKGIRTFVSLLPNTWLEVLADPRQARRLEATLPVEQVRRAMRVGT